MTLTPQTRRLHLVLCEPQQPKVQELRPLQMPEQRMQCALNQVDAALVEFASFEITLPELVRYRAEALEALAERLTLIARGAKQRGLISRWFGNGSRAP